MSFTPEQRASSFVRFMSFVAVPENRTDCWVWQGNRVRGLYGHFSEGSSTFKAHRWIYECLHGAIPDGQVVRHHCDNPGCVNPEHLALGTPSQNVMDAVTRGRWADRRGEKHPLAQLDAEKVRAIRALSACGNTQHRIATQFGISRQQVGKIIRRENWGHV